MKLGGAEKHVIRLAAGLRQKGHDAGIVCVFKEGALADEVRRGGIPFDCLGANYKWGLRTFSGIFDWLRRNPADVLHTYLFGFDFYGVLPARLLKMPAIVSSRREIAHWQKKRHLFLGKLGNLFVDRIACCSEAAKQWVIEKEKVSEGKTVTIYNGVDLGRFSGGTPTPGPDNAALRKKLGIPPDAVLAGTVANFSFEKGYPYLLDAVSHILEKRPEVWFLFVGGGPLSEEMKDKARSLRRKGQVIFPGFQADIPALLGIMDVFVLASVIEGFPNVILEAMAMGKPVVATRTGGIPELIRSGYDGILVPPKDGKHLADAILSCLDDPAMAKSLGENARKKIAGNFSMDRMVDGYEQFYRSILKEKGKA